MELNSLLSSLDIKADWLSLREVKEQVVVRSARKGNLDPLNIDHTQGVMVEVLVDGQFACAGTCDLTREGVQKAAQRALDQAKKLKDFQLFHFDKTARPPSKGTYFSGTQRLLEDSQAYVLNDLAVDLSNHLKTHDQIIHTMASFTSIEQEITFVSSNGANIQQRLHQRGIYLLAVAQDGHTIQTRTNGFPVVQAGDEFFDAQTLKNKAIQIAEEAIELTQAQECPTGLYDLILMPDQLYLQIHESIGHPLELDRILGDERNYAGWSFVKPEDFGHLAYGSPLLNITFDPSLPGEITTYHYDDTGTQADRQYIIKEGILKRGIGGLESQTRSGIPGTSSARAQSWNRAPIDRMANINMEPGSSKLADMISSTERGILMKTNRSWSIDDYRNKFQFGCEYGQLIENGQLTKTVKNPNYRGITTPFWHSLKMVGDPSTHEIWGAFYCGKGEPNQVVRVGHATPACLFTNVEVFGGGAA